MRKVPHRYVKLSHPRTLKLNSYFHARDLESPPAALGTLLHPISRFQRKGQNHGALLNRLSHLLLPHLRQSERLEAVQDYLLARHLLPGEHLVHASP